MKIKKIKTLGYGGYGKVDLVIWKGKEVAVKYMNLNDEPSATLATCALNRETAEKEGAIMALFKKKDSIAELYAVEGHAIFMEYFPEGSLRDLLDKKIVTEERYFMLDDIVAGLSQIHQLNFVHSDLKASNILCRTRIRINCFITDFGIAKKKGSKATVGTPGFKSPSFGKIPICFEEDIYALGKVCIELFTGFKDMRGIEYDNFHNFVYQSDFTNNKNATNEDKKYSLKLMNLVHECLNPNPLKRPTLRDFYDFVSSYNG